MKFKTEQTDQGTQAIIPGAEPISEREMLERRMQGAAKAAKPQKSFEATELAGGLAPHQESLF